MSSPARRVRLARHYQEQAQQSEQDGSPTWLTRGANFVVAVTHVGHGTKLTRAGNPDEYMVILPQGVGAEIRAGQERLFARGDNLVICPPGDSEITTTAAGVVARIFSSRATDLAARSANAASYLDRPGDVAPLQSWPEPHGGYRIFVHNLSRYYDPAGPLVQPRLFRSTNMMVNVFAPWNQPRDTSTLSPHWHEDFEQATLCMAGEFVHHIRYPWGRDMSKWLEDEHLQVGSPSTMIIPPGTIHTTRSVGEVRGYPVDIFAPPRADYALKPGFILNEADYPLPEDIEKRVSLPGGTLMTWQQSSSA